MTTLYEFGIEVQKIREAAESITVKGVDNASRIVYINQKCNEIIKELNKIMDEKQKIANGQNGSDILHVELQTDDEPIMTEDT